MSKGKALRSQVETVVWNFEETVAVCVVEDQYQFIQSITMDCCGLLKYDVEVAVPMIEGDYGHQRNVPPIMRMYVASTVGFHSSGT